MMKADIFDVYMRLAEEWRERRRPWLEIAELEHKVKELSGKFEWQPHP
jgi:hypothetical protein